jgi:hypothetical protein
VFDMHDAQGKTGIEIQAGLSPGQRMIGKILHTLHLDGVTKAVAGNARLKIEIDGVEREEPLYEAHFVECAAGEHELKLSWYGNIGVASETLGSYFNEQKLRVTVEPGTVTELRYTPKDGAVRPGHTTTLEIVGKRPA